MVDKLQIKAVYNDFISNVNLTEEQKQQWDSIVGQFYKSS